MRVTMTQCNVCEALYGGGHDVVPLEDIHVVDNFTDLMCSVIIVGGERELYLGGLWHDEWVHISDGVDICHDCFKRIQRASLQGIPEKLAAF